jgi:hypothetical protein
MSVWWIGLSFWPEVFVETDSPKISLFLYLWSVFMCRVHYPVKPMEVAIWPSLFIFSHLIHIWHFARFDVLTVVLLRIQIFWDVMTYCWVSSSQYFKEIIPSLKRSNSPVLGLFDLLGWRNDVPFKHQEPLTQWHTVTFFKTLQPLTPRQHHIPRIWILI